MPAPIIMQRVRGRGVIAFKFEGGRTRLANLYQNGAAKIRLPKTHANAVEAILINTAGGLTSGDDLRWQIDAAAETQSIFTTQACEKAYHCLSGPAVLNTHITLGAGAALAWLPQETILYEGAHLCRRLEIDLAKGATLLATEATILGREAMGETLERITFRDSWRIMRQGKLIHAEETHLSDDALTKAQSAALLNGNRAFATVLIAMDTDLEALKALKASIEPMITSGGGISALQGKIIARLWAPSAYQLRQNLVPFLQDLNQRITGAPLPRVWRL